MNRIEKLFAIKNKNVLSIYFTAGYPELNDTINIISELAKSGVDMIEIGMPFSDPVADGPVIQRSNKKALSNGMTIKLLFEQLEGVREITDMPLILMGYINPAFKFGMENFLIKCRETGIDGVIIPDLPVEEYRKEYEALLEKYNIFNIFLISSQTPDNRITYLDSISRGFLYIVSTASTTGIKGGFSEDQKSYFKRIKEMNLTNPKLIGFGISDNDTFAEASRMTNGAVIGSAFVKMLGENGAESQYIMKFVKEIRGSNTK